MNDHKNEQNERRRYPRVDSSLPVKICTTEFDAVTETQNLSRSGVYCRVSNYIEPMTKLDIQLLLTIRRKDKNQTRKISCGGVVVRTEAIPDSGAYHVAIFFYDIQEKDSSVLKEYVQNRLNED
ncbi:MAG: PilZ domain-containing protein [Candidatus Omnitrophota bacterium]